jgi:hypothetical protein
MRSLVGTLIRMASCWGWRKGKVKVKMRSGVRERGKMRRGLGKWI